MRGWGRRVDRGDPFAASLGLESSHILIGAGLGGALAQGLGGDAGGWVLQVDRGDPFAASLGLESSHI